MRRHLRGRRHRRAVWANQLQEALVHRSAPATRPKIRRLVSIAQMLNARPLLREQERADMLDRMLRAAELPDVDGQDDAGTRDNDPPGGGEVVHTHEVVLPGGGIVWLADMNPIDADRARDVVRAALTDEGCRGHD